jgi:monofunctional biosynthetic peptidoglycan transglycosylase
MASVRAGLRRLARWVFLWLPLWFLLLTTLQVLVLRWVPPVTSAFMVSRQLDALLQRDWDFRLAYNWRSHDRISRNLPIALVAAEDQTFPFHHGFDFKAIDKAMANNQRGRKVRGASTSPSRSPRTSFFGRAQLSAQGARGLVHSADRAVLAEATHPRGVREYRGVR